MTSQRSALVSVVPLLVAITLTLTACAGEAVETFGTGASTLGAAGTRYFCSFTDPSVDLIVVQMDDDASYAELQQSAKAYSEAGNEQTDTMVTIGEREILVKKTVYPTNDTHIDYTATYFDADNLGTVILEVEAGETRGLIDSYDEQQAAEDLAAILDNA